MKGREAADVAVDRTRTGSPKLQVRAQPGYYPGFDTLGQRAFWDETTRATVLRRLEARPEVKFFTAGQAQIMQTILDRILPQDDRDAEHRIPLLSVIDQRLYQGRIDGYRFEDMPPDRVAYVWGLEAIEEMARSLHEKKFIELAMHEQEELLKSLHDAKPAAAKEIWQRMPVDRFWMLLLQDAIEAYYAHPYAWNEIGFGGPAYPRAYMRLERGEPEPWEVVEQRYEWSAPEGSVSSEFSPVGGAHEHHATPGQGGTH